MVLLQNAVICLLLVTYVSHAHLGGSENIERKFENPHERKTAKDNCCGVPSVTPVWRTKRILRGEQAREHSWPWQVRLEVKKNSRYWRCGGSILSKRWVVTAAHCLKKDLPTRIYAGVHELGRWNKDWQYRTVEKTIVHPKHSKFSFDIALLKLKKPLVFNDFVSSVCLPTGEEPTKVDCVATGWGVTTPTRKRENINGLQTSLRSKDSVPLMQVKIPIRNRKFCPNGPPFAKHLERYPVDRSVVLCAGGHGKTTCKGDSGGPLVCKIGGAYELFGITSFGASCDRNEPIMYVRVSQFTDWIRRTMDQN